MTQRCVDQRAGLSCAYRLPHAHPLRSHGHLDPVKRKEAAEKHRQDTLLLKGVSKRTAHISGPRMHRWCATVAGFLMHKSLGA